MFPHERRAGGLQLARAAMAGIAGVGKNLRRRLAGIQVRLRLGRRRRPKRKADQPRHDPIKPRHHDLLATTSACRSPPYCPKFLAEKRMRPRCPALAWVSTRNFLEARCRSDWILIKSHRPNGFRPQVVGARSVRSD